MRRVGLIILFTVIIPFVLLAVYTNVPTKYTAQDEAVFEYTLHLKPFKHPQTFAQEIEAIKFIQKGTFSIVPKNASKQDHKVREPAEFLGMREGICYDRSRTTDKAIAYIGLPSRHVFLLFRQGGRGFLSSVFRYHHPSHAVTEVKTSKGWMLVDSTTEWIALTRDGQVVNADDVWKRSKEFNAIPSSLVGSWWAIRGMYSRSGYLYPPYIFFPDFNWPDFFNWLIFG